MLWLLFIFLPKTLVKPWVSSRDGVDGVVRGVGKVSIDPLADSSK